MPRKSAEPAAAPSLPHDRIDPKHAELERRAHEAEQKLADTHRQARKLAHDLNNALTGIVGYNELIMELLPPDHPTRPFLEEARNACLRARGLTEQIGAMARSQDNLSA